MYTQRINFIETCSIPIYRLNGKLNLFLKCTRMKLVLEHLPSVGKRAQHFNSRACGYWNWRFLIASLQKARASLFIRHLNSEHCNVSSLCTFLSNWVLTLCLQANSMLMLLRYRLAASVWILPGFSPLPILFPDFKNE